MIRSPRPFLRLFALSLLLLAPWVAAQPLLAPLPAGDLSKLPAPAQQELRKARADFEQARVNLIGEGLAQAYVLLGAQYARVGVLDVARVALANATALAPFEGRWFYLSGVFQAQAGDNAGARTALLRALELDQAYLPIRYRLAQVQVALNKEMVRLRRVLLGDSVAVLQADPALLELRRAYPDLLIAAPDGDQSGPLYRMMLDARYRFYVIDPLGNVMMRYPENAEGQGMLRDLERLLKYSWVG